MVTRFKTLHYLLIVAAFSLLATASCAPSLALDEWNQYTAHSGQSIFDVMSGQEILEITLSTPLDSIVANKKKDVYADATVSFNLGQKAIQSYRVKVKARGKFRRLACDFPPLKLKFSKKELEAAGLEPFNELKVVTHCLDDEKTGTSIVLREYLAYKLYNELTPYSFRVQLAKINYQDTDDPGKNFTRWGFVIEDNEELIQRMGGVECDCMGKTPDSLHANSEKINSLFEYMIGNTDWNMTMLRNVKLVRVEQEKLIPVPYDFDFSQFVKAPYRRPNPDLKQTGAMERIFMGHSDSMPDMYATIAYFKTKKEKLLDIVQGFDLLEDTERLELVQYLEGFFQLLQSEEQVSQVLFQRS